MDEWIKKMYHTETVFNIKKKNLNFASDNDIHATLLLNNHPWFPVAYQLITIDTFWCSKLDKICPQIFPSNVLYHSPPKLQYSVAQSCLALWNPMNYSPPGSSVMGFPRQEYWSGLPCSSPGNFSDPGMKPVSPALADGGSLPLSYQGSPINKIRLFLYKIWQPTIVIVQKLNLILMAYRQIFIPF